jgi:hypothetical protein
VGDGGEGLVADASDGGPAEAVGELAHAEDGELAVESVEAGHVLVQRRQGDAEPLRDLGKGELVEPAERSGPA